MLSFFKTQENSIIAVGHSEAFTTEDINKLCWLFGNATLHEQDSLSGKFAGPRREMITPWSTNAVEITQNMGIKNIQRIEEFLDRKSVV